MKLILNKDELSDYIYALSSAKEIIDKSEFPLTYDGINDLLNKLESK